MAMISKAGVDVNDLVRNCTLLLKLKGTKRLRFRLWLASKIFKFGGWVTGMSTEVFANIEGTDPGKEWAVKWLTDAMQYFREKQRYAITRWVVEQNQEREKACEYALKQIAAATIAAGKMQK